jgi:SAM-dependent methyltransferase
MELRQHQFETMHDEVHYPLDMFNKLAYAEGHHWWFRSRNRILLWVLQNKCLEFCELLEVGCGTGFVLEGIRRTFPNALLTGAEYYEEGLVFARSRIPTAQFVRLDATQMVFRDSFDIVGAFDVLEHIEVDKKALSNFSLALRSGGYLILSVPQHRWLWSLADTHAQHIRRYSRSELVSKVRTAGFQVCYMTSFVSLLLPLMWLSRSFSSNNNYDPMDEFNIPEWLNSALEFIMSLEIVAIKIGFVFPAGGSLLLLARKP